MLHTLKLSKSQRKQQKNKGTVLVANVGVYFYIKLTTTGYIKDKL